MYTKNGNKDWKNKQIVERTFIFKKKKKIK